MLPSRTKVLYQSNSESSYMLFATCSIKAALQPDALPAMRVILRLKYRTSIKDYFQNGFPKIQRNVWDLK